jgi:hypothetical protein
LFTSFDFTSVYGGSNFWAGSVVLRPTTESSSTLAAEAAETTLKQSKECLSWNDCP